MITLFQLYPRSRQYILNQLISTIIINNSTVLQTVQILSKLIVNNESIMIEHIPLIKELIENIASLTLPVATIILQSVQLLLQYKTDLVDFIIVILKKLLLNRNLTGRLIGIEGLIIILKSYGDEISLSQVVYTQCIVSKGTFSKENHLYQEIIGYLKRCLSQQYEVRFKVYKDLASLYISSPNLRESISTIYVEALKSYINNSNECILLLTKCLNGSKVIEPLDILLNCIEKCAIEYIKTMSNDNYDIDIQMEQYLIPNLLMIIEKFSSIELMDLNLDKTRDFSRNTHEGENNIQLVILLSSILHGFMDYVLLNDKNYTFTQKKEYLHSFLTLINVLFILLYLEY